MLVVEQVVLTFPTDLNLMETPVTPPAPALVNMVLTSSPPLQSEELSAWPFYHDFSDVVAPFYNPLDLALCELGVEDFKLLFILLS
jgi:hypothetical protein